LPSDITISQLRHKSDMLARVADSIWHTWSLNRGLQLGDVVGKLERICRSDSEFTLVAHKEEKFVGTISVIETDLDERAELTPWVAAVWVDRKFRKLHIGSSLMNAAEQSAKAIGHDILHLCCAPQLSAFYTGLGWTKVEDGVGNSCSSVFKKLLS